MERLAREGGSRVLFKSTLLGTITTTLTCVFCPSGERIYFNNRKSDCGGELDVDMNVRPKSKTPIENVVWTDRAPDGEYKIGSISIVIITSDEQRKRANSGYVSSLTASQGILWRTHPWRSDVDDYIVVLIKPDEEE